MGIVHENVFQCVTLMQHLDTRSYAINKEQYQGLGIIANKHLAHNVTLQ
jgi:hypothetical protein